MSSPKASSGTTWVVTIPHGLCYESDLLSTKIYNKYHGCDFVASLCGSMIARKLRETATKRGDTVYEFQAGEHRNNVDLNRPISSGNTWHQGWKNVLGRSEEGKSVHMRKGICVLDIHSFDDIYHFDSSGKSTVVFLDSPPGTEQQWVIRLSKMLTRCSVVTGSEVNYITVTAKTVYRVPSVLVEFWEGLSRTELEKEVSLLVSGLHSLFDSEYM